jgi:hypothetical protein
MSFNFTGFQLTPGMHDDRFTQEAQIYWGRWDQIEYLGGIVSDAARDDGDLPDTQLRAGLAMGNITATGMWGQWNPYATDGTQTLKGFLLGEIDVALDSSTNKARVFALMVKGNIKADQIVIADALAGGTEPTRGIAGTDYEFLLREQAAGRFLFDDDMGALQQRKVRNLIAGDTTITATTADNNTTYIMTDAVVGDATITLPAPVPGLTFYASNCQTTGGDDLIFEGPATGEYWVASTAADNYTIAEDTSIIQEIRAVATASAVYKYIASPIT